MEIDKKLVGKNITLIRKNLGLTMEEFGELVDGASKSNVSKWENGSSLPNSIRLKKIAELGNVTIKQLIYGDNEDIYKVGKHAYDHLLKEHEKDTHIGKALRYFTPQQRDNLIIRGTQTALTMPIFSEKNYTIEDIRGSNGLIMHIMGAFTESYENNVKTNSNFIYNIYSNIEMLTELGYKNYNIDRQYPLDFIKALLLIEENEASVDDNLIKDMDKILQDTLKKIEALKIKYPDMPQQKTFNYHLIFDENHQWVDIGELSENSNFQVSDLNDDELNSKLISKAEEFIAKYLSENPDTLTIKFDKEKE